MTQLICLVQRLYLKESQVVKENEVFEVEEPTASEYVNGGIAKPVPKPDPKPEPKPEPVEYEPPKTEVPEKVIVQSGTKKRNR